MTRTTRTLRGSTAAVAALALAGAALPALADAAPKKGAQQPVAIRFAALAGSTPVSCERPIEGLGTTGAAAELTDLRFFVSDVRLLRKDGRAVTVRLRGDSPWRVTSGKAAVTLIDLENGRGSCAEAGTKGTNAFVRGTVPRGEYVGASWSVGVPFALNHTDATTAAAPLNSAAMAWSWQVGRKFTKIEVSDPGSDAAGAWAASTFFVHLGSTGCEGNPATGETVSCASSNRAPVTLRRFDPVREQVAVDLKAMLAGVDVTVNGGGAPGCMGGPTDPECPAIFRVFGLRAPTGGGMEMGDGGMHMSASASAAAPKQTVFRAIKR